MAPGKCSESLVILATLGRVAMAVYWTIQVSNVAIVTLVIALFACIPGINTVMHGSKKARRNYIVLMIIWYVVWISALVQDNHMYGIGGKMSTRQLVYSLCIVLSYQMDLFFLKKWLHKLAYACTSDDTLKERYQSARDAKKQCFYEQITANMSEMDLS